MWSMSTPIGPNPPTSSPTTNPTVAFTTPSNYAGRLSQLLTLKGFNPLWCPTLTVQCTTTTISALKSYLSPKSLDHFSALAFTSRTGISAFSDAVAGLDQPPLPPSSDDFTIAALGKDSELINDEFIAKLCKNRERIRVLVPPIATPSGLVSLLGDGRNRKVLCPVPSVVDLEEPPTVPDFLRELESARWVPVRAGAYETRWAGRECAREVAERVEKGELDAIVFTSTAEVEGLLKSLREFGLSWREVKRKLPGMVAAAHGPVTAAGAERLGVEVDLVGAKFESFDGVVNALRLRLLGSAQ
ncbi:Tetrapyrrole biosynthesis, uroporphyrinogen III synthase [Parasponia andersonii]|uniref:Tetrapyrrole biosynthesis, uroporphyrinogen III synthase n=1 Tax=Parasponia andersonii TaxID=3476 RepID=A0A2P5D1C5_PARAD|nr:Tetrapyrrole biosynthesis, uroporphyrinogen III synthase [Parasponia andersonii]